MQKLASKLPRRLILIASIVLLAVVLVHFAGVALLRHYAEEFLHPPLPQGTRIGEVDLNLFTGALQVKDFELQNEDGPRIRFSKLELKISPWRLFTGKVHVQRARLSDGFLRIDRRQDGSYDLGVPPFGDQEPTPDDTEPAAFSLAGAILERVKIEYHDGKFFSNADLAKIEMGAYSARAKTQEIPLSWQLSLDEREVSGQASLTIDKGQVAAAGKLKTQILDLARVQRLAALDPLVKGEAAYQGDFTWQAPQLTLTGALNAPALVYKVGDRLISISGVDLPDFELKLFTAPELAVELAPREGSRAAKVEWKTAEQLASAGMVRIAGRFRYEDNKLVNVQGLQFNAASFGWQDGSQRVSIADFGATGTLQQGIAGELRLPSADLQLRAARFEFEDTQGGLSVALDGLEAEGLKLRPVEGGDGSRQIEGRLSVAASRVGQADTVLNLSALIVDLGGNAGLTEVRVVSDASVGELKLESPVLAHGPLRIARISAEGLQLGTESQFQTLKLQGLQLAGDLPETGVKVTTLSFSDGSYAAEKGFEVGEIVIDGLQTAVIRDKSGQWRHPGTAVQAQEPKSKPEQAAQETPADPQALNWRVGRLSVTGDSYITTGDRTNPAAVLQRNSIDVLTFGELASARPDQDTPFEIGMHPDKYTSFQIKGVTRPLVDPVYLDAKGELQGLGMPRLNGYIANDLGHKFLEGQLDVRFDVKIADNKLKMGNFLELHRAVVESLEGKDGPPLTTAIALLEDRDGYVKLEVPVEGRLDDPNFRVLAALNPIIMKAVAGTAALAIQPLGSVLLVGSIVADQALKVSFNPALFEAGSTQLDPETQKYLGELAGKLKEKPKLAVRICGVVAEVERQKDKKGVYLDKEEALLEMAQQRAQAVRSYMNSQGAGTKQLRSCRPSVDPKPEGKPRVDIRL
jgi:hypothetical protein